MVGVSFVSTWEALQCLVFVYVLLRVVAFLCQRIFAIVPSAIFVEFKRNTAKDTNLYASLAILGVGMFLFGRIYEHFGRIMIESAR